MNTFLVVVLTWCQAYTNTQAVLFSTSPTATAFGIETKAIQPFPAVTVCNQNPFVASKLTGTRLAPLLANKPPQRFNRSAVAAAGHDASTMVFLCQLGPFECDPDELYTYVDPSFGLCFTFNSGAKDFTLYGMVLRARVVVQAGAEASEQGAYLPLHAWHRRKWSQCDHSSW